MLSTENLAFFTYIHIYVRLKEDILIELLNFKNNNFYII